MFKRFLLISLAVAALTIGITGCLEEGEYVEPQEPLPEQSG